MKKSLIFILVLLLLLSLSCNRKWNNPLDPINTHNVLPSPTFNPPGGSYATPQNVTISCLVTGAEIRYTIDGTTPTQNSNLYTQSIYVNNSYSIKAKAFKSGYTESALALAAYTINNTVALPTFNPPAGTYSTSQNVTISCSTSGAEIRYTTGGTDPTQTSMLYSAPIVVTANTTLKAKAYKSGLNPSSVSQAVYTVETIPVTGLVAHYPLNGNANDTSGNGYNGILYGPSAGMNRFGQNGMAVTFSSSTDWIDIPDVGNSVVSVSMWYKFGGTGGTTNSLLCRNGFEYHHLLVHPTNYKIGFNSNLGMVVSDFALQIGQWYHLVMVKNHNSFLLYANNVLIMEHNNCFDNQSYPIAMIGNGAEMTQGALGNIDDVRIYNRVLTSTEVSTLYHEDGWTKGNLGKNSFQKIGD